MMVKLTTSRSRARFHPGDICVIPDKSKAEYFAAFALDLDVLFFDKFAAAGDRVDLTNVSIFLRLPVTMPSILRSQWRKIGEAPLTGRLNEYGRYLIEDSISKTTRVYDNRDASTQIATESDKRLELLAVWDAQHHIIPLLRYHFFREDTPIRKMIRAHI